MAKKNAKSVEIVAPATVGTVVGINPDQVVIASNPLERGRYKAPKPEKVVEMAMSFAERGQDTPIQVVETKGGMYTPVFGSTRASAAKLLKAGFKATPIGSKSEKEFKDESFTLKAEIVTGVDGVTLLERSVGENVDRTELSPMDLAATQQQFREAGKSENWIANFYHCDKSLVNRNKSLLTLPDVLKDAIHDGNLTRRVANEMLSKPAMTAEAMVALYTKHGSELTAVMVTEAKRGKPEEKLTDATDGASPAVEPGDGEGEGLPVIKLRPAGQIRDFCEAFAKDETLSDPMKVVFSALLAFCNSLIPDSTASKKVMKAEELIEAMTD